jgi:metal-responsive CopG/Arc/MetJ family transcriptional regulator
MSNREILTLSLPKSILQEVNAVAKEEKLSKSELFRMAVIDFIGRLKWERAAKHGRRIARNMKINEADIEDVVHAFRKK